MIVSMLNGVAKIFIFFFQILFWPRDKKNCYKIMKMGSIFFLKQMASEIVIPLGLCFRIESVLLNKYPYAYCDLLVFYLLCPCICILHFSLIIFWGKTRAIVRILLQLQTKWEQNQQQIATLSWLILVALNSMLCFLCIYSHQQPLNPLVFRVCFSSLPLY